MSRFRSLLSSRPLPRVLTALFALTVGVSVGAVPARAGDWVVEVTPEGSTSYDHTVNKAWYFLTVFGPSSPSGKGVEKWSTTPRDRFEASAGYIVAPRDRTLWGGESSLMHSKIDLKGSVSARLRWVSRRGQEETDLPPLKVRVAEESLAQAFVGGNLGGVGFNHPFDAVTLKADNGLPATTIVNGGTTNYPDKKSHRVLISNLDNPQRKTEIELPTRHLEASSHGQADGNINMFQRFHHAVLYYRAWVPVNWAKTPGGGAHLTLQKEQPGAAGTAATTLSELGTGAVGGRVWAGVELQVNPRSRLSPDATQLKLRISEDPDPQLGDDQHPETENHVDPLLPLSPNGEGAYKWQKRLNNTGPWQDTSEAFTTPNESETDKVNYRVLWAWDTHKVNQLGTKLWDHNGKHTVKVIGAQGGETKLSFEGIEPDQPEGNTVEQFGISTVNVGNLVIADVSTSNGTSDYFKFSTDQNAPELLLHPYVKFKISASEVEDLYRWRVRVRSTDIEDNLGESVLYSGESGVDKEITVTINSDAADQNSPKKSVVKSGTYTFDISVDRIPQGKSVSAETVSYRSRWLFIPTVMPVPNEDLPGHDGAFLFLPDAQEGVDIWVSYFLRDDGPNAAKNKPAFIKAFVDVIPPSLGNAIFSVPELPIKLEDVREGEKVGHLSPSQFNQKGVYTMVFSALDNYAERYRDHKSKPILAKNRRQAAYTDEWDFNVWMDGGPNAIKALSPAQLSTVQNYVRSLFNHIGIGVNVNYMGTTTGANRNYGGTFSANVLSQANLVTVGDTAINTRGYHTAIWNEVPNASSDDPIQVAAYHPYGNDWNGSPRRPGLITIIVAAMEKAKDDLADANKPTPPAAAFGSDAHLQYIANCIAHEAYHCLAMTTNRSHCSGNVATCLINRSAGGEFAGDMRTANAVTYHDFNGNSFLLNIPFHSRSEVNRLMDRMNHERHP